MKLKLNYIKYFFVLFPFFLAFIAEIVSFRNQSAGSMLKLFALSYMLLYSVIHQKFDSKLVIATLLFLPVFIYHIYISFNFNAAIEEAIRYLFPVIILIYGFTIRRHYLLIINFIILYAVLNVLYQPIAYINWIRDVHEQWFYNKVPNRDIYYYNEAIGIIRGVGLMGFFATFGFLNLVAYFLTKEFYTGKCKQLILILLVLGVFSSLSFKAIGVFVFLMFLLSQYKAKLILGALGLLLFTIILFPKKVSSFSQQLGVRIEVYITEGNSARAESYRVMLADFKSINILGRGVGSFGGASSTKYNSPVYKDVNFNWFETKHLATTDTYYPHVFVEMGIIGGLLYFLILVCPLVKRFYSKKIILLLFVIYFSLFFDSLFSFALNNLAYLLISLVLVYPILEHEKIIRQEHEGNDNNSK
ncbi:MAG: hypothetical protein WA775_09515 [Psychroserpens sp.]|uniref:hypothetical protein n=1 Tax=Psychroserpens sp. TaxID=2020870 RepID=UPI003C773EA3